ncbi:hypothetical protein IV417_12655 [Alphaproteobacteria bacterium KMM 3653]|uniref:O-antigen/teichoic acid export membrane protein n=1 Tax=Harenicola maris TaxID=2841044 RepID=A0AAP2G4F5_9RHOB|nr:hypothetical protein [Harenicola maris]
MSMTMSSQLVKRLAQGTGANLLGKIWVLIIQLVSVPVMTAAWGADGFGVWLMISTIPTYLALSDFGLGTAAAVDITSAVARGDKHAALRAYQAVWCFLTASTVLVAGLCILGAILWMMRSGSTTIGPFEKADVFIAICLTIGSAFITLQINIQKIVFHATHKYALGTLLTDTLTFLCSSAVLVVTGLGYGIATAAATFFVARTVSLLAYATVQKQLEPWCTIGWKFADRNKLRQLLNPSLAALSLTVANSFGLQGVVLTIGWVFGPATAAVFATTRMLTRVPLQLSGLVTRASLPELTRAQVTDNKALTARLMKLNILLTLAVMIPAPAVLGLYGPELLNLMSHGEMTGKHLNFIVLGLSASICALWTTLGTRLIAVNRQSEYAYAALALYTFCAIAPFATPENLMPVLVCILVADSLIFLRTLMKN